VSTSRNHTPGGRLERNTTPGREGSWAEPARSLHPAAENQDPDTAASPIYPRYLLQSAMVTCAAGGDGSAAGGDGFGGGPIDSPGLPPESPSNCDKSGIL